MASYYTRTDSSSHLLCSPRSHSNECHSWNISLLVRHNKSNNGSADRSKSKLDPTHLNWIKLGEVHQHDQYVIKVDWSGRVTVRNRKFLRKFSPFISTKTSTQPMSQLPLRGSVKSEGQKDASGSEKRYQWHDQCSTSSSITVGKSSNRSGRCRTWPQCSWHSCYTSQWLLNRGTRRV